MKKIFLACALALIVMASSAQAATFSFDSLSGSVYPTVELTSGSFTATFDNFVWYNPTTETLDHYLIGPLQNTEASITFNAPVKLDGFGENSWNLADFSGTAFLGSASYIFTDASEIIGKTLDKIVATGTFGIGSVSVSATPIPGAIWLLGSGLLGLLGLRRRAA